MDMCSCMDAFYMCYTSTWICACAWTLSALFSIAEHPHTYDSNMHFFPDYARVLVLDLFQTKIKKKNTMTCVNFLVFIMPRKVEHRHEVPVIVVLHGTHFLSLSTVEVLLNWMNGSVMYVLEIQTGHRIFRCYNAYHFYCISVSELFERHIPSSG